MQITARHYATKKLVDVEVSGERIASVRTLPEERQTGGGVWIAPSFVDLQVNGYDGQEFSSADLTPEKTAHIVRRHLEFGVTGILPTLTTNCFEALSHGCSAIAAACEAYGDVARMVLGIHVEGPYISNQDGPRGAHPLQHCRKPDWDEFCRLQHAAKGRIRLLTLAAEFDEAPEFISKVVATGVTVAIGHTAANGEQIRAAVDAGATLSTHLGNGSHGTIRRHPNYIWDQMAEDRLMASLIVDGHHLPGEVVKSLVRAKTPERCILVSDESGLAGLPPGKYQTQLCELEILPSGKLVVAGQTQILAGASLPIGVGVTNVMRFAGVDLATAIHMASSHAERLIGRVENRLRPGDAANLIVFELPTAEDGLPAELRVLTTLLAGHHVYQSG